MSGFDVEIDDKATRALRGLARGLKRPGRALRSMGKGWERRVKKLFQHRPPLSAAPAGQPPAMHTGDYRHSITSDVISGGAALRVGSSSIRARLLHEGSGYLPGGVVRPKTAKALAIPIDEEAYGKGPREFSDLVLIKADDGDPILWKMGGSIGSMKPMFVLKPFVRISPHPHIEIVGEDVRAGREAMNRQFDREMGLA